MQHGLGVVALADLAGQLRGERLVCFALHLGQRGLDLLPGEQIQKRSLRQIDLQRTVEGLIEVGVTGIIGKVSKHHIADLRRRNEMLP